MIGITVTKRTEIVCDMAGTMGDKHFICETIDLTGVGVRLTEFAVGDTPENAAEILTCHKNGYRKRLSQAPIAREAGRKAGGRGHETRPGVPQGGDAGMKATPIDVDAIIEELRTTGQSKIDLPQPVDRFCKALKRIDRAVEPDSLVCEARPGDSTMVLRTKKVTP